MAEHRTDILLSPDDRPTLSRRPAPEPKAKKPKEPKAPREERPKKAKAARRSAPVTLLRRLGSAVLVVGIWGGIAVAAVLIYYSLDLPDLSSLTATLRKPSITILASDDEQIAAYGDVYGESLPLDQMPKWLPEAVLATEDRHFYSHFGVDPIGLARALFVDIRTGHMAQGG